MPLTNEQATLLAAELAKPAYNGATDEQARTLLNTPSVLGGVPGKRRVPSKEIELLAWRLGVMPAVLVAKGDSNTLKQAVAISVDRFFTSDEITDVDTEAAEFTTMLANMKAVGLLSTDHENQLKALADITTPTSFGPTPFQAIQGLGDVAIPLEDGTTSTGSCFTWMVTQARGN